MRVLGIDLQVLVAAFVGVVVGVSLYAYWTARATDALLSQAREDGYNDGFQAGVEIQRGRVVPVRIFSSSQARA